MPDGSTRDVDVRTIPIWRFEENEAHTEGLYGAVVAANGNGQPDTPIQDPRMLEQIQHIDWTSPDTRHPHHIRGLKIWEAHYAFRPQSPSMWIEDLRIHRVAYGVYRPALDNQVYRNVHLSDAGSEPFNRGMDDASAQNGSITVDGLTIDDFRGGDQRHPVVHMTDNDLTGKSQNHFRRVTWAGDSKRRPVFNRGGSVRVDPFVSRSVPYFVHDYFGPGRHAKIVSSKAADLLNDGHSYRREAPLTGDESLVAEVPDIEWPKLLDPVDDVPPATIVTHVQRVANALLIRGVAHDNGEIAEVSVNGKPANIVARNCGVVDWELRLESPRETTLTALARDADGNVELTPHRLPIPMSDRRPSVVSSTGSAQR